MQLSAPIREPSESHNATEQYILQQTQEIGRLESGRACCVRKDAQSIVVAFSAVSWTLLCSENSLFIVSDFKRNSLHVAHVWLYQSFFLFLR